MVEFSPATRETGVRFPANAFFRLISGKLFQLKSFRFFHSDVLSDYFIYSNILNK